MHETVHTEDNTIWKEYMQNNSPYVKAAKI